MIFSVIKLVGVGKSSFISTCITDDPDTLTGRKRNPGEGRGERVIEPILLPLETALENSSTLLIDSSGEEWAEATNKKQIKKASSILLFYDMSNDERIDRLEDYWLPMIEQLNPEVPVIIVGSKLDLIRKNLELSYHVSVYSIIKPLIKKFKQVQMGIECSSRQSKNIIETLYCAQSVVKYPLGPLMDQKERELTEGYKKALTRIFRVLDEDNDKRLNDTELIQLQQKVFNSELSDEDLKALKDVIKEDVKI